MRLLIQNIQSLLQVRDQPPKWVAGQAMSELPVQENAYLLLKDGKIQDYGSMQDLPSNQVDHVIDASGRIVLPGLVDSHSHIVFAGSREHEFVDKIKGLSYQEIAQKGGGILNSAKLLQQTPEEELYESALHRVNEVIGLGTGALEIKSGYGLTLKDELKMLRVARKLGEETPLTIRTTFLGAHAFPQELSRQQYIDLILNEMIPAVAEEKLADYIDVFCEEGFFNREESEQVLTKGMEYGLIPKVHANQLNRSGGVQVGVKTRARSVDHLETVGPEEIEVLKGTDTIATLLPGAAFFLRLPYPPAPQMIQAGLPVALASDYNPGSAPSGNMMLILSLACIGMKMTPEQAINAATLNGAYAMDLYQTHGSITRGKVANVIITKPIPSYAFLPYAFGSNLIDKVILRGEVVST